MRRIIKLPEIAEIEKSPLVSKLWVVIEQQASIIGQQNEKIQLLKDEIARLKNQSPEGKRRDYKQVIDYWLLPEFSDKTFFQITGVSLKAFITTLVWKKGKKRGGGRFPLRA